MNYHDLLALPISEDIAFNSGRAIMHFEVVEQIQLKSCILGKECLTLRK